MRTVMQFTTFLLSIFVLVCMGACVPKAGSSGMVAAPASQNGNTVVAQAAPALPADAVEDSWPRTFTVGTDAITIYPPNIQSWSGTVVTGTCAFSRAVVGAKGQTYGTMSFTAATEVNKLNRMVTLSTIQITGLSLPENPADQSTILGEISGRSSGKSINIALDRFEAAVPGMSTAPSVSTAPLQNNPPQLSIVTLPTVLVPIQGAPVMQPLPGTSLQRVINTPMLLVQDTSGNFWLKIADGWMTASALNAAWTVASPAVGQSSTADLLVAAQWAVSQPSINLLAPSSSDAALGSDKSQTASLAVSAPVIVVSTTPAEVLVIEGIPKWVPAGQSGLLYVSNTSANIFQLQATATTYVTISGRWFSASSIAGPWTYVSPDTLPGAFMMIPQDSPKENVLASIPGTVQAQEATIANSVPQMARVPITQVLPPPVVIGGSEKWQPVTGTSVMVLSNCATPVFRTSPNTYFAVENGIWFTTTNLKTGWVVASWVPPAIYAIPPSNPYYYVTYVRVYNATPTYVLVGYTPGYFGAYMQGGVVVYGTGYAYVPYCSTVWVPVPMTYGSCASMTYNPWAGWAVGFGMGMAVGWAMGSSSWHCGPYPYWGPYCGGGYGPHGAAAWGPHGWAATTGNVYHQWGSVTSMSRSSAGYNSWTGNEWSAHTNAAYNSTTGARAAGQTGHVQNAYTGNWADGARGAGYNPTTGNYAAGKGVVAGTPGGTTVAAGAATIGNTKTGQSASVAGVSTANGTWGVAHGENGTAVATGNNVYGMQDGNAYKYDQDTNSWQQAGKDSSGNSGWNSVNNSSTTDSLNQQKATRDDGDARASNSDRWQSGGSGYSGNSQRSSSSSWGGGGGSRGGGGGSRGGGGRR